MSFCSSLRRRPSCSDLIPILQAPPLSLRENNLKTHDLAVQLPSTDRYLRFVILTPSTVSSSQTNATITRLEHHVSLTGGKDCAILFFLSPQDANPLHTFNTLQIALANSNLSTPLLPLTTAPSLPKVVAAFGKQSMIKTPSQQPVNAVMDLLPFCTTEPPMKHKVFIAMTDLTACLRDIAELGEADAGRLVEGVLGEEELGALLGFWAEEWVAE